MDEWRLDGCGGGQIDAPCPPDVGLGFGYFSGLETLLKCSLLARRRPVMDLDRNPQGTWQRRTFAVSLDGVWKDDFRLVISSTWTRWMLNGRGGG